MIFSFEPSGAETHLRQWINTASRPDGEGFTKADFEAHVREKFSTCTWIVEGMLRRAGFDIVSRASPRATGM